MNERDIVLLRDMVDAARRGVRFVDGKSRSDLEKDDFLLGYALVRAIEIVGEAATKVSEETKGLLPDVRWHEIIGMRHRIVHDYGHVDYQIVWDVSQVDLPELLQALETFLATLDDSEPPTE